MAVLASSLLAGSGGETGAPIRAGRIPPPAEGFLARTETAPRLPSALAGGAIVVLAPERPGTESKPWFPSISTSSAADATGHAGASEGWACVTGKTQIAAAYADWLHRSGTAIIWADAGSRVSVLAGYATAAASVGVGTGEGADVAARRLLAVLGLATEPWLVVLDGLQDAADVQGLIPSGPAGMTLITTADARLIPDSWGAVTLGVSPFSAREAMSYVRDRLTSDLAQRAGMFDLVTEIGGEPAALAQACGVIAGAQTSCRQYAERLVARRGQIAQAAGAVPSAAAITFTLGVERADQLDAAAWPILAVAAALDSQQIPWVVFGASTIAGFVTGNANPDLPAVFDSLRLLAHLGLVSLDSEPDGPVVRASRPVLDAVRSALSPDDYDLTQAAAVAGLTEAWTRDEPSAALGCKLATCSLNLWRVMGDRLWSAGACPPLLHRAGDFMITAGMLSAALNCWLDLAAAAERLLDPDHPDRLMISRRLAALLLAVGEPAQAAMRYELIFNQLARSLGADHPAPVAAELDLGRSLAAAGQFHRGVAVLEDAATGHAQLLGPDHPETVAATEALAAACVQAAEMRRAIVLYQRVLADRLRLQGARHPDAIAARHRLARAYLAAGDAKAAVSEGKKVVADRQRELGEDHLDTIAAIGDLGTALLAAGKLTPATQMLEQAEAGYEQILGADHRDTLARRADLARAYNSIGWIVDAAVLLRDTAERCDRLLPRGDPLTTSVHELLAGLPDR
jgi:tetratricopeptide (TPR) repeat protein